MSRDVVVVPPTPALLPAYAGTDDPVAELRSACRAATAWLVDRHPERVRVVTVGARDDNRGRGVSEPAGSRVAAHLLAEAGFTGNVEVSVVPGDDVPADVDGLLVLANGSATRSEKAPGHLDQRSFGFDEAIETALRTGDGGALRRLDRDLGAELWAHDVPAWQALGDLAEGEVSARLTYADDPYGVRYWVVRWTCGS